MPRDSVLSWPCDKHHIWQGHRKNGVTGKVLKSKCFYLSRYISKHTEPKVNSLAPVKFEWNFRYLIFLIISVIDGWCVSWELALRWMSLNLTDDKSTLVQVMACCLTAPSHYLSQCWPRSLSPYGVIRPQWVKHTKFSHVIQSLSEC